jgi:signal-transduction protein with cAMP-binding, CBS, and nucleotidyltransferase domain
MITKNNFELAIEYLSSFKSYAEMARKIRKDLGITFYLSDDEIKYVKEPTKIVIIIKKDVIESVLEKNSERNINC